MFTEVRQRTLSVCPFNMFNMMYYYTYSKFVYDVIATFVRWLNKDFSAHSRFLYLTCLRSKHGLVGSSPFFYFSLTLRSLSGKMTAKSHTKVYKCHPR
jgi:hypothetical protein